MKTNDKKRNKRQPNKPIVSTYVNSRLTEIYEEFVSSSSRGGAEAMDINNFNETDGRIVRTRAVQPVILPLTSPYLRTILGISATLQQRDEECIHITDYFVRLVEGCNLLHAPCANVCRVYFVWRCAGTDYYNSKHNIYPVLRKISISWSVLRLGCCLIKTRLTRTILDHRVMTKSL